ncbi:MAG: HPF/RaiA family ribosome-associated protein [Erysipelotrichaceae bacterium]|nr:HPF/RaiA family ribosome-associated protein [Erysipelotrichaceae bacterium]
MKYQIVCNGTKLSASVQQNVIDEISKIEKLLFKSEDFECRIVVKFKDNKSKVEVTIPTPFLLLRTEVEALDLIDAVEIARDKLVSQIDKIKSRLDRSSNRVNLGRTFGISNEKEDEEQEDIYIKNKTIHPSAMTLDDAIMEMESTDHDFFIYEDVEDHTLSVVYRRKDGGYGVIEVE